MLLDALGCTRHTMLAGTRIAQCRQVLPNAAEANSVGIEDCNCFS